MSDLFTPNVWILSWKGNMSGGVKPFHHCLKASLLSILCLNVLLRSPRRQWEWIISCTQWWLLVTLMWSNGIRGQQEGQSRYSRCNYSIKPNISGPGQWWMAFLKANRIRAFGSDGCSLFPISRHQAEFSDGWGKAGLWGCWSHVSQEATKESWL